MKIVANQTTHNNKPSFQMRLGNRFTQIYMFEKLAGKVTPEVDAKYLKLRNDEYTNNLFVDLEEHHNFRYEPNSSFKPILFLKIKSNNLKNQQIEDYVKDNKGLALDFRSFEDVINHISSIIFAPKATRQLEAVDKKLADKEEKIVKMTKNEVMDIVNSVKRRQAKTAVSEKSVKKEKIEETPQDKKQLNKEYQKEIYDMKRQALEEERRIKLATIRSMHDNLRLGPTFDAFLDNRLTENKIRSKFFNEMLLALSNPKNKGYSVDIVPGKGASFDNQNSKYSLEVKSDKYSSPIIYKRASQTNKTKSRDEFTFNEILSILNSESFSRNSELQMRSALKV